MKINWMKCNYKDSFSFFHFSIAYSEKSPFVSFCRHDCSFASYWPCYQVTFSSDCWPDNDICFCCGWFCIHCCLEFPVSFHWIFFVVQSLSCSSEFVQEEKRLQTCSRYIYLYINQSIARCIFLYIISTLLMHLIQWWLLIP